MSSTYFVYPITNYKFGRNKAAKRAKDANLDDRLKRLKDQYNREGIRTSVFAVLLVMEHNIPHLLLLQGPQENRFELPGGRLKVGEGEIDGLRRKLTKQLSSEASDLVFEWDVSAHLGTFHRPNHGKLLFPYVPSHVTRPKEVQRIYMVQLPDKASMSTPQNQSLVAVPLFDLYDNVTQYGPVVAAVPTLLSRLNLVPGQ